MKKKLLNVLNDLEKLMTMKGLHFRARAYHVAAETLIMHPYTNIDDLATLPNIGPSILKKFKEFEKTGKLKILEEAKGNPIYLFTKIYGIGPKKAKSLVKSVQTIAQLREQQDELLNNVQKKGLKYFEDSQLRIPRSEIDEYKAKLDEVFKDLDNSSRFEIVGSYRRGQPDSGDIDIIITNNNNDIKVFREILNALKKCGLLIETFSKGKIKSLTMGRICDYPARRLDFMYTPPEEYAFAILYFTGSKAFNVAMRGHALNMGYTMNEHTFHKINGEKVKQFFTSEKAIFNFLSLEYKTPKKRVDGNAIIIIKNVESVVNFLSKKYNFDVEEAMKYLGTC